MIHTTHRHHEELSLLPFALPALPFALLVLRGLLASGQQAGDAGDTKDNNDNNDNKPTKAQEQKI